MFQQFSYKKKFYALAILAILLGATAYKRSFKGTLDAIEFYYHSKKDLNKNDAMQKKTDGEFTEKCASVYSLFDFGRF